LSPTTWAYLQDNHLSTVILTGTVVLVAAPFAAMLFGKSKPAGERKS
jgi:hypothetical protein